LIVHGLASFDTIAGDSAASLTVDSVNVADLQLQNLVLHTLTVDGVVSWTQQVKFAATAVSDTRHVGNASALSGDTLVVAGEIQGSSSGVVYVYVWTGSGWSEQAKLYAGDRASEGQGFGAAVAIDGNTLAVGAP